MSSTAFDTGEHAHRVDVQQHHVAEQHMLATAKGGGITFGGKLFTFGCRFVMTLVLARQLGAEQYGLYNLALTSLTVAAALAVFGLDSALVRYIAIFQRRRDEQGVWGTLQIGLGITAILSLLLGFGLFMFATPIAEGIFDQPQLAALLRIVSIVVPFLALSNVLASATQGFKKMQYATLARDIVQPLIRLMLIVGLVMIGLNPAAALIIFGIAISTSAGLLLYFLHKVFGLIRPPQAGRRDTKQILSFSIPVFLSDLMTTFRENIQTLLLGAMSTVANVGVFAVANQINQVGSMFQSAIATAARPIISELYDQGEYAQMGRVYQTTTKWTVTANLPLFLTMLLFPEPILAIFGKSFVSGTTALILVATAIMADISTGMCGNILDMTGHTGLKLFNSIIRLAMSLVLSVLLIPDYGVVGAALVALIVVATVNVLRLVQVFVLFRLLPYDASFIKPLGAATMALLVVLVLKQWLPSSASLLTVTLQIALLFSVYGSVILLLGLSADDRLVLGRVRRRLRIFKERRPW